MAAGEWVSVSSQRELLDASIPDPGVDNTLNSVDVDANELALLSALAGKMRKAQRRMRQMSSQNLRSLIVAVAVRLQQVQMVTERRPIFATHNG